MHIYIFKIGANISNLSLIIRGCFRIQKMKLAQQKPPPHTEALAQYFSTSTLQLKAHRQCYDHWHKPHKYIYEPTHLAARGKTVTFGTGANAFALSSCAIFCTHTDAITLPEHSIVEHSVSLSRDFGSHWQNLGPFLKNKISEMFTTVFFKFVIIQQCYIELAILFGCWETKKIFMNRIPVLVVTNCHFKVHKIRNCT